MVIKIFRKSGFTLIELLVAIAVICILAVITTMSYTSIQAGSRDSERNSKATILANALEKYYNQNGEYPSTSFITQPSPNTIRQKLDLKDNDVLIMPGAPAGTTNSITPTDGSTTTLAYNGASVDPNESAQCEAATVADGGDLNGGCDQFTLQWTSENSGDMSIESVHKDRSKATPLQAPTAPDDPTITIAVSGTTITATAATNACSTGQLQYKLDSNTTGNDPDWSSISWSTTKTKAVSSAVAGTQYYFYAIARCYDADAGEGVSNTTENDIFYSPAGTPTITASFSSSNAIGSVTPNPSCDSGLTTKYYIEYRIDTTGAQGSWTVGNNWTTASTYTIANATAAAHAYNFRAKVRCDSSSDTGTVSPVSSVATVLTAPGTPSLSIASSTNKDSKTWQWSAVACPVGTTTRYLTTYYIDNGTGWYPWPANSTNFTATSKSLSTNYRGYEYRMKAKARCTIGSYVSAWGSESNAPSYIRQVEAPGKASDFTWPAKKTYTQGGYKQQYGYYYWAIPNCGLGASPVFESYYYSQDRLRSNDNIATEGFTSYDGNIFSGNDLDAWKDSSTTTNDLLWYYTHPGSVPANEITSASGSPTSIWKTWMPSASNPIQFSTSDSADDVYLSKARVEVRYACLNLTTKRYAVGNPALSGIKYWSGP